MHSPFYERAPARRRRGGGLAPRHRASWRPPAATRRWPRDGPAECATVRKGAINKGLDFLGPALPEHRPSARFASTRIPTPRSKRRRGASRAVKIAPKTLINSFLPPRTPAAGANARLALRALSPTRTHACLARALSSSTHRLGAWHALPQRRQASASAARRGAWRAQRPARRARRTEKRPPKKVQTRNGARRAPALHPRLSSGRTRNASACTRLKCTSARAPGRATAEGAPYAAWAHTQRLQHTAFCRLLASLSLSLSHAREQT